MAFRFFIATKNKKLYIETKICIFMLPNLDKELRELVEFFEKLPKIAGNEYLNHFLDSFRKGGFTDESFEKWDKRAKREKDKRKRALLVKTGRLVRSLRMKTKGTRVEIGTAVPYAQIHNEGGIITGAVNVAKHKRRVRVGRKKIKKVTVRAHKRHVNTKIPKRQFMGESATVDKKIIQIIEKELDKIFK